MQTLAQQIRQLFLIIYCDGVPGKIAILRFRVNVFHVQIFVDIGGVMARIEFFGRSVIVNADERIDFSVLSNQPGLNVYVRAFFFDFRLEANGARVFSFVGSLRNFEGNIQIIIFGLVKIFMLQFLAAERQNILGNFQCFRRGILLQDPVINHLNEVLGKPFAFQIRFQMMIIGINGGGNLLSVPVGFKKVLHPALCVKAAESKPHFFGFVSADRTQVSVKTVAKLDFFFFIPRFLRRRSDIESDVQILVIFPIRIIQNHPVGAFWEGDRQNRAQKGGVEDDRQKISQ